MNAQQARESLRALSERLYDRDVEISQIDSQIVVESDDEADRESPILDLFYKAG